MTKTTSVHPRPLARAIAVASLPLFALGSAAASAQSNELQELRDRIQKLEAQQAEQETGTAPEPAADNDYLTRDGAGFRIGNTTMTIGGFIKADVLAGSNGRFDQALDGAVGGAQGYLRFTGNRSHSDDYDNGNGDTVPSRWDKWNGDVALGWTPDDDSLIELTAGRGDGEAGPAGGCAGRRRWAADEPGLVGHYCRPAA